MEWYEMVLRVIAISAVVLCVLIYLLSYWKGRK